jgi:alkaline phosphatase
VVTTVPFNHATPAAFASHNVSRANYSQIADEMLGITRPDVLIGGGHPGWGTTYFSAAALGAVRLDPGWTVMERAVGAAGGPALLSAAATLSSGRKLFGIFGGSGGDFERPRPENSAGNPGFQLVDENPTLADEVQAALTVLARNPAGFFLMAEEGAIDHANHANDYAGMIGTVWQLDEAVKAANAFVDLPGDDITWSNTLVVVTADHANGLMRLTGAPALGKGELPQQTGAAPWSYPGGQVTWGSTGHTNELVTLAAKGAGAFVFKDRAGTRYPGTQILDNTEVYGTIMQVAGAE